MALYKITSSIKKKIIPPDTMHPHTLAEEFNKTLCTILEKMVGKNKKTWPDKLPETLRAYKTTVRIPT